MAKRNEFVSTWWRQCAPSGQWRRRRCLAAGALPRGAFFALIAGDALYFKVDDENRPRFARVASRHLCTR